MDKDNQTLKTVLDQIIVLSDNESKREVTFSIFSTLIAQLEGRIPYQLFHTSFGHSGFPLNGKFSARNSIGNKSEMDYSQDFSDFGDGGDKKRIMERLGTFKWKESEEWGLICKHFGCEPSKTQLLEIAKLVAERNSITLDRDSKRRKSVLVKWFHENWSLARADFQNVI